MIKVSVLYLREEGVAFDMAYYLDRHIPMVRQLLGAALKNVAVEQGMSGLTPGSEPEYAAMGHLYFETVADFQVAFGPHANTIVGDVPNYTKGKFSVQISEVKM
jgi:uncharacterized protein (TIGR02118 family)